MEQAVACFLIAQQETEGDNQYKGPEMIWPESELVDHMKMDAKSDEDHTREYRLIILTPVSLDQKGGTDNDQKRRPGVKCLEQGDVCLLKIKVNSKTNQYHSWDHSLIFHSFTTSKKAHLN